MNNYHPNSQILIDAFMSYKKTKKEVEDKITNFELSSEVRYTPANYKEVFDFIHSKQPRPEPIDKKPRPIVKTPSSKQPQPNTDSRKIVIVTVPN